MAPRGDARSALAGRAGIAQTLLYDGEDAQRGFSPTSSTPMSKRPANARVDVSHDRVKPSTAWTRTRTGETLAREHGVHAESIADLRTGDAILRFSTRTIATFAARKSPPSMPAIRRSFEGRATVLAGGARPARVDRRLGCALRRRLRGDDARDQGALRSRRDPRAGPVCRRDLEFVWRSVTEGRCCTTFASS